MTGPPDFMIHNFPMWFSLKYFGFAFNSMLGSGNNDKNLLNTMLPVRLRRQGILADTNITNRDMTLNFNDYPIEKISVPVLVIHAKDDPLAKYKIIENLLERIEATSVIYDSGGHMLEGHDCSMIIYDFIHDTI